MPIATVPAPPGVAALALAYSATAWTPDARSRAAITAAAYRDDPIPIRTTRRVPGGTAPHTGAASSPSASDRSCSGFASRSRRNSSASISTRQCTERLRPRGPAWYPLRPHERPVDDPLHARERVRAHEQLHRHRQGPRASWAPGDLRGRGVVEGPPGAARVRRGPGGPGSPSGGRRRAGCRAVLDRLRDRDRTRVPQTDDRTARDVHRTRVVIVDGRRDVLRAAAARDPRSRAARRDRRGQRQRVPGAPHPRRAVGEDHELQPARDERPGPPADLQRLPAGGPDRKIG